MSRPTRPNLLRRLLGWTSAAPDDDDAADMGTAIGLEYVLDQPELQPAAPFNGSSARVSCSSPAPWWPLSP